MTCPLFYDGVRQCITKFDNAVTVESQNICESDNGYHNCIFYRMYNQPEKEQCKFIEICGQVAVHTIFHLPLNEIKELCETYCLSKDNQCHCAIFKLIDELKDAPPGLLPDGRIIKVNE